ncbi:MAG TPA: sigma-70 family RNA polymerase sigma factor [Planctomycetes bacterium]|nr:sigma-70 family RNA polymerase sigma factor [Planctomycetota bacterium]
MVPESRDDVTGLLRAATSGSAGSDRALLRRIYSELLGIARSMLRGREHQTLQPTALVHEAYLRLVDRQGGTWESRRHFFFAAARAMRDIMVEQARRRRVRADGRWLKGSEFDELAMVVQPPDVDLLALDSALEDLEKSSPRLFQIVQLRFFAGLTMREVAEVLGLSQRTVERDWRFVRAILHVELSKGEQDDLPPPSDS